DIDLDALVDIYGRRQELLDEKQEQDEQVAQLNREIQNLKERAARTQTAGRQIEQSVAAIDRQLSQTTDELARDSLNFNRSLLARRYDALLVDVAEQKVEAEGYAQELQRASAEAARLQGQADQLRMEWLRVTDPFGKSSRGEHERALA